jgi:hypothetical protein
MCVCTVYTVDAEPIALLDRRLQTGFIQLHETLHETCNVHQDRLTLRLTHLQRTELKPGAHSACELHPSHKARYHMHRVHGTHAHVQIAKCR